MHGVLLAVKTEFLQFQPHLDDFLVLARVIVRVLAHTAFEFDEVILRHIFTNPKSKILNPKSKIENDKSMPKTPPFVKLTDFAAIFSPKRAQIPHRQACP